MARTYQANCSFQLQDATLENLKILAQIGGSSVNKTVNQILSDYVAKFTTELAKFKNVTRTAAREVQEKIFGEKVSQVTVKKIPTNNGTHIAVVLDDQIIAVVKVEEVDEEKAMQFVQKAISTIGNSSYEITRDEKSIAVTVGDKTLSQEFEGAGTAERVEGLIDEVIAQISKLAFQGN